MIHTKNQKLIIVIIKKPTMIIKANRKIKTQIFKSTKFFNRYIILINTSNDSRCTSFLKRRKKKKKARN